MSRKWNRPNSTLQHVDNRVGEHLPIEPPCMVLALQVRSRGNLATARAALAENIGDTVDVGIEPYLSHPRHEPFSCSDVLGRERDGRCTPVLKAPKAARVRRSDGMRSGLMVAIRLLEVVVRQCSHEEAGRYPGAYRIGKFWTVTPA
jgi:hypothetical protein